MPQNLGSLGLVLVQLVQYLTSFWWDDLQIVAIWPLQTVGGVRGGHILLEPVLIPSNISLLAPNVMGVIFFGVTLYISTAYKKNVPLLVSPKVKQR